jgi:hypothetical protein
MKKRIIDNWKATLLGVVIALTCGALVITKQATFAEVSGFLTLSGLLAWVKDSIFKV